MSKWLDAARAAPEPEWKCRDNSAKRDKSPPIGTIVPFGTGAEKLNRKSPSDLQARDPLLAYSFAVEAAAESFPAPGPSRCAECGSQLTDRFIALMGGARVCNDGLDCLTRYGTRRKRHGVQALRKQGVEPPQGWTLPDGTAP